MGRGSSKVGGNNSAAPNITVDTEFRDAYWVRDYERDNMGAAVSDVTDFVNRVLERDPDMSVDGFYNIMGDTYARRVRGDDAELVYGIDYDHEVVTSVDVDYRNFGGGDIRVDIRPFSRSFEEFSPEELEDMGVNEWDWNEARRRRT